VPSGTWTTFIFCSKRLDRVRSATATVGWRGLCRWETRSPFPGSNVPKFRDENEWQPRNHWMPTTDPLNSVSRTLTGFKSLAEVPADHNPHHPSTSCVARHSRRRRRSYIAVSGLNSALMTFG